MNVKRNTIIDFAKGATIILMIYDHVLLGGSFITSFHMPLFFILSGYFFKDLTIKQTLIKKAKGLLIPYAVTDLTYCVLEYIKNSFDPDFQPEVFIKAKVVGFFTGNNHYITWFFIALFFAHIIYAIIIKLSKGHVVLYTLLVLGISVVGYIISTPKVLLPFQIDIAMVCVLFIAVGHMYNKYAKKISCKATFVMLGVSLVIWIWGILEGGIVLSFRYMPWYPLCVIAPICGTYVVMFVYKYLDKIPYFNELIRWFGRNTISIMFLGGICVHIIDWGNNVVSNYKFLSFVVQLAAITILVFAWDRIKLFYNSRVKKDV